MSEEIIRLIGCLDQKELDTQVALQCAPILTGIKLSNILIVSFENKDNVVHLFSKTEILCEILHINKKRITFLIYRKEALLEYLNRIKVMEYMNTQGYNNLNLKDILIELSNRYRFYMEGQAEFPHELGLILGYPLEDVKGFIDNQGKNFLCVGYWKVYHNQAETIKLFEQYTKATEKLMGLVVQGFKMRHIIMAASTLETI